MELPTEIWTEILSYCDTPINHRLKQLDIPALQSVVRHSHNEINNRVNDIKKNFKIYDVVRIESKEDENDVEYGIIQTLSKNSHSNYIKCLLLKPSYQNSWCGYYTPKHILHSFHISLTKNNIYLQDRAVDVIKHNKWIASRANVGDVIEITPLLFKLSDTPRSRHFAMVRHKISPNHIEVQEICFYTQTTHYKNQPPTYRKYVSLERYYKFNTKNVLTICNIDDWNYNEYGDIVKHKIPHIRKLWNIINHFKEVKKVV